MTKTYKAFKTQVEKIETERDLKAAHIAICQSYSNYELSHKQFMSLRDMMITKREQKGFSWGEGI
ncbi:MAG: hypothetical protein LUH03_10815 [Oscillospiraceae bacterium]|nr:hypothetical protein [Oscillospiraceae bacterium]